MAVVVQRQLSPDLCFVLHTTHPGELSSQPCSRPASKPAGRQAADARQCCGFAMQNCVAHAAAAMLAQLPSSSLQACKLLKG
jgi:hypothetical protein